MSTFEKIADKSSTICVGALAFALGDPSGGIVVATGLGGLAAVGIALRKNCAKRARENAIQATIVALRDTPEFDGVNLERANALLQDRQEHTTLNSGHLIAAYKHGAKEARIAALVELLHATIPFDGDTNQIKTLLRHALTAAMRSCYDDKDFRAQLNEETLIDIARKTDGLTTTVDRVEKRTEKIEAGQNEIKESLQDIQSNFRRLQEQHKNDPEAALADLRDIAIELNHPKPHRENWQDLIVYITNKVQQLQATITRYEQTSPEDGNANARSEIARLLRERRYAEVQKLFDGILEMGRDGELNRRLEEAAFALEGKADLALIENRVEDAYDYLSRAADSFAGIDPLETAEKRFAYHQRLRSHGDRFGGEGFDFAVKILEAATQSYNKLKDNKALRSEHSRLQTLVEKSNRMDDTSASHLLKEVIMEYLPLLATYMHVGHKEDAATVENSLGRALNTLVRRNTAANRANAQPIEDVHLMELALWHLSSAVDYFRSVEDMEKWAGARNNYANARKNYAVLFGNHDQEKFLFEALEAFDDALTVITREKDFNKNVEIRRDRASARVCLGQMVEGNRGTEHIDHALKDYEEVIKILSNSDNPRLLAETHANFALMRINRAEHNNTQEPEIHLKGALRSIERALSIFTKKAMPNDHQNAIQIRDYIKSRLSALAG
ncbi:hypothetical protein PEL8287_02479 [Roseovarius litorisediminis]|uniref:Tetratricopeptide repeat protein n=1 Tax=Roseovarius litorisediminis TaxID=1312363 RepID=A0A1Y5SU85_9RHOB|nr:hypothetical protein [Roseovarius litorisediminis]SLN47967.1 hypothetical protein PEL8287_02479 [Roseovarius litorisediminis]